MKLLAIPVVILAILLGFLALRPTDKIRGETSSAGFEEEKNDKVDVRPQPPVSRAVARAIARDKEIEGRLPPKFKNDLERKMVESVISTTEWPGYDGVELTPDQKQLIKNAWDVYGKRRQEIREIFYKEGRDAYRAELRKTREDFHNNLKATLGEEKALEVIAASRKRGEEEATKQLFEAMKATHPPAAQ
jgi:hypothetical protein